MPKSGGEGIGNSVQALRGSGILLSVLGRRGIQHVTCRETGWGQKTVELGGQGSR